MCGVPQNVLVDSSSLHCLCAGAYVRAHSTYVATLLVMHVVCAGKVS